MSEILNIYLAPKRAFEKLKEKPSWFIPLLIVLLVVAITAILAVSMSKDAIIAQQEERMRERGMTDEQIDQAARFMGGPLMMVSGAIGGIVMTVILLVIFAALLLAFIKVAGGQGGFQTLFAILSWSALVRVPASVLRLVLIGITGTPFVTTSLALALPGLPKETFAYRLLAGLDFFMIWEMILVATGLAVTCNADRKRSYVLVFAIWVLSVLLSAVLGGMRAGPR
jgi:hypothetical protein